MPVVQVDVQGLAALIGVLIPIVVAAITKKYSSPQVKSAVNLVVVVIGALLAYAVKHDGPVTFWSIVNVIIVTLVSSIGAYHGVWKPAKVYNLAPRVGLGTPSRVSRRKSNA